LESSSIASWVSLSLWAYPALLTVHIVGLALVVGLYAMRDFQLIGLFSGTNISLLYGTNSLSSFGIAINLVSGFLLFSSQATFLISSVPFLVKISCIVSGLLCSSFIRTRQKNGLSMPRYYPIASLLFWTIAIISGRLIAYF
jgi:hypothetical protein